VKPLLVFDGDCGFCTSAVEFVRGHLRPGADIEPWQHLDLTALGLTQVGCEQAVQYRDRDGRWSSGGRAVAEVLRESRVPWSWLGVAAKLPGLRRLVDLAYRVIAANRHRLPGGTPACQMHPGPN
jgi:predicted DCC family thiol-disulfide oxidoreductase YuxK